MLVPAGIALGTEKHGALVVIESMDSVAIVGEANAYL